MTAMRLFIQDASTEMTTSVLQSTLWQTSAISQHSCTCEHGFKTILLYTYLTLSAIVFARSWQVLLRGPSGDRIARSCRHTGPDLKDKVKDRIANCYCRNLFWASGALPIHDCMPEKSSKNSPQDRKTIFETLSLPVARILSPVVRQAPTKFLLWCNFLSLRACRSSALKFSWFWEILREIWWEFCGMFLDPQNKGP